MSNIISRECRFAKHIPVSDKNKIDKHLVKELITYEKDGKIFKEPKLTFVDDFERNIYLTKKNFRNHSQKKEWEELDKLSVIRTTESELCSKAARALGYNAHSANRRIINQSPYLYGTDVSSTSLLKREFKRKYPNAATPYSVMSLDLETDCLNGTTDPIIATLAFENISYLIVTKDFIKGHVNVGEKEFKRSNELIGDYIKEDDYQLIYEEAEDTVDLIIKAFKRVHQHKPDILTIWNMNFDIPKILSTLEKYKVDPIDVLCDPEIPRELRYCNYVKGKDLFVTASGIHKPLSPAEQWHVLNITASYQVLDQMCVYYQMRLVNGKLKGGYGLDNVAKVEVKASKLHFDKAEKYKGLKQHVFMQSNYKIEYLSYARLDSMLQLKIDKKTKDLKSTISSHAQFTDFCDFKSNPKKIVNALHYYLLEEKGKVLGTKGPNEKKKQESFSGEDDDDEVNVVKKFLDDELEYDDDNEPYFVLNDRNQTILSLKKWILTLPAFRQRQGLKLILEDSELTTSIRCFLFDADATSAYPTATIVTNLSKSTTQREIIGIEGKKESIIRRQNMNALVGSVNSIEYCCEMFDFPKASEMLKLI